ncbi:hypothetical protein [Mesorhizobium sp. Z1-4]|uniref:hypothetical protein n=1 Tax=Mesorhizobium sp. Z1-4 TaxID=2448478 RepID=UPI000FDA66E6|nr:hypothetical protein [Mesorhizobium sp. Z1-4]
MSVFVPVALGLAALLVVVALVAHYRASCRTRRLGGFYVVPAEEPFNCPRWQTSDGACCPAGTVELDCPGLTLRKKLTVIEGGKI